MSHYTIKSRPYNAAHFGNPNSRGARGECGRCGTYGKNYFEYRIGCCWVAMCRDCSHKMIDLGYPNVDCDEE